MQRQVDVHTAVGHAFTQHVEIGPHRLLADEPAELKGEDLGPAPHDWLLAGLGACTSMTVKMYADRKGWPLDSARVLLNAEHVEGTWVVRRDIELVGPLDAEQRRRLIEIANKCPVHKTLSNPIRIETHEHPSP